MALIHTNEYIFFLEQSYNALASKLVEYLFAAFQQWVLFTHDL